MDVCQNSQNTHHFFKGKKQEKKKLHEFSVDQNLTEFAKTPTIESLEFFFKKKMYFENFDKIKRIKKKRNIKTLN
jgi:hypothetical protein